MVDGEGDGRRLALGVHAEDHRHGPLAVLGEQDPPWRLRARPAHPLQGLGAAVAIDQGAEGGVELRRISEAMRLDRADEAVEVVALGIVVPAACLGERDVAQLELLGFSLGHRVVGHR